MIDVGDPVRNIALNAIFFAVVAITLVAVIPWGSVGAPRIGQFLRWLMIPVLVLAIVYEWLMPSRFDIRIDLVLLLPMYVVIIVTSAFRWWRWLMAGKRK